MGAGVSVLSVLQKGLQGWIRTASTRRIVRRVKKPLRGFFRCAARAIHPRPPRTPVSNGYRSFYFVCLKKGMQGWIRTAAEPTAACGGNREARLGQRSAFSKPCQGAAEKAASATRKTRRIVRRVKKPLCNSDDRCQRQKQGGAVGAAASRMRVPPKARCSRWEPRPGFLFSAARVIHPRPPKNRNVSKYAAVLFFYSSIFTSPAHQSSWARILFCTISPAGVRARVRPSKVAYPARTQFCTKASCAVENCLPYRAL